MYVDPSLIDFNLHAVIIDGVDCIANYVDRVKTQPHDNLTFYYTDKLAEIGLQYNDGVVSDNCIKLEHIKNVDSGYNIFYNNLSNSWEQASIDKASYTGDGFTITLWAKIEQASTFMGTGRYGGIYLAQMDIVNKRFRFNREGENWTGQSSYTSWATMSVVPPTNEWFYCTITYATDGTCKLYINGQLSATRSLAMTNNRLLIESIDFHLSNKSDINNVLYLDDIVCCRKLLWTDNFTPPTTKLLDIDYDSFDIDLKVHNNLIAYPAMNRIKNILKVY